MENIKMSAVVLTKNEEKNIEECLKCLSWADEIIVIDSFSSDKTTELASKIGGNVFQRAFDNYAAQRNYGNSKAKNDWVFSVDADERITEELKNEIFKALNLRPDTAGYMIPTLDYMFGRWIRHGGWYPQYHVRLYNKTKARWDGDIHEKLLVEGEIKCLKEPILHYSHLRISDFVKKMNLYTDMEAKVSASGTPLIMLSRIIIIPIVVFFYKYIYQLGFLDRWHGMVLAVLKSFYHFLREAKRFEKQRIIK
jgi:glycosyltransferase involved in cell wall biosynthesis